MRGAVGDDDQDTGPALRPVPAAAGALARSCGVGERPGVAPARQAVATNQTAASIGSSAEGCPEFFGGSTAEVCIMTAICEEAAEPARVVVAALGARTPPSAGEYGCTRGNAAMAACSSARLGRTERCIARYRCRRVPVRWLRTG